MIEPSLVLEGIRGLFSPAQEGPERASPFEGNLASVEDSRRPSAPQNLASASAIAAQIRYWESFLEDMEQGEESSIGTALAVDAGERGVGNPELIQSVRRKITAKQLEIQSLFPDDAAGRRLEMDSNPAMNEVETDQDILFLRRFREDLRKGVQEAGARNDEPALRQALATLHEIEAQLRAKLDERAPVMEKPLPVHELEIRAFTPIVTTAPLWREADSEEVEGIYAGLIAKEVAWSLGASEEVRMRIYEPSFYPNLYLIEAVGAGVKPGADSLYIQNLAADLNLKAEPKARVIYDLNKAGELHLSRENFQEYVDFFLLFVSRRLSDFEDCLRPKADADENPVETCDGEDFAGERELSIGGNLYRGVFGVGVVDGVPGVLVPRDFRIGAAEAELDGKPSTGGL